MTTYFNTATTGSTQTQSSGVAGYGTWIILGVVVALIVIFVIYSAVKDRVKKNRIKKNKLIFENKAQYHKKIFVAKLHYLIKENAEKLNDFEPSIGKYTMGEITKTAHLYLESIQNDKDFKEYIVGADSLNELLDCFINLRDTRSNLWDKKLVDTINKISTMFAEYEDVENDEEIISAKNEAAEFYAKELK
ncbi:MHJ_0274 family protein [Mycoplasmopsis iners]|uniref:MHJ_0274 family protein n=1 Tax=Mycoplasmopsis iners TaxID=76630 RepID=UPI0006921D03|nr:FeoB-associated Cys-rich membrane protein [Mycoplasmopsis iners]